MDGNVNLLDWYWEMPIVTRLYFTGSFLVTVRSVSELVCEWATRRLASPARL